MKYLLVLMVFLVGPYGAYKYGAIIGSEQTYLNMKAYDAVVAASNLRGAIDLSAEDRDAEEAKLTKLIIEFGRYLEEGSRLPALLFSSNKKASEDMISRAVGYRREHPRIKDGVENSPFKNGWREYFNSPEYQVDLMELSASDREQIISDEIADFEKKERWYRTAIEHYGNQ